MDLYTSWVLGLPIGIGAILFGMKGIRMRLGTKLSTTVVVTSGILLVILGAATTLTAIFFAWWGA